MMHRVLAGAVMVAFIAGCGGDGKITEPRSAERPRVLAAVGTDPMTGATIETNQDDYVPGEVVHLTGRGWAPNETVHLVMTEDPDTHDDVVQDVQADGSGAFTLHFYDVQPHDLGVTFTLTATGQTSGSVAVATFTDGRDIHSISLNGVPAVTVAPGASISAVVQGALTGGGQNTLGSISIRVFLDGAPPATPPVVNVCFDVTPDQGPSSPSVPIPYSHTIGFLAPATAGQYDVTATSYGNDTCNSTGAFEFSVDKAITVQAANTAPVLNAIGDKSIDEGSTLTFTASATDSDVPAQTLSYSLFGAPAGAAIDAGTGVFTWTPADGPQTATFTVRVTDNGMPALSDEEEITVTVNNVPPVVSAGMDASLVEGGTFSQSGSFSDPGADTWTATVDYGDGTGTQPLTLTPAKTFALSHTYADNGNYTVTVTVTDDDAGTDTDEVIVSVSNAPPVIASVMVPLSPVAAGVNNVTVSWTFTDPGADTWSCQISWDAGQPYEPLVPEFAANPTKTCSATKTLGAGIYSVTVKVMDDDGGSGYETAATYIVVYDPSAGFVTGGGWINSPPGAYVADPELVGKANFGFVSKYKKGQTVPDGNTEFQFHAGNLNFKSIAYEWLVVAGARAQFKGTGSINGSGTFGFMLSAIDGQAPGGGGTDRFRMKIWTLKPDGTEDEVVYDNQIGAGVDEAPTTALGGGSINIQAK